MATEFFLKKNDTLPILQSRLSDSVGYVDLSAATGVRFIYKPHFSDNTAISRNGTIASAISGLVQYNWTTGDATGANVYRAEWIINFSGGSQMTFPNDGYIYFEFKEDLL